jgi:hypothetical protein
VELKPYVGVTMTVAIPWLPALTVSEFGVACKVNVGGGVMVSAAEATALLA